MRAWPPTPAIGGPSVAHAAVADGTPATQIGGDGRGAPTTSGTPCDGRPKLGWAVGACPGPDGSTSPVALAFQPLGGYRAAGVLEPGGGVATGGLSQRRV